MPYTEILDEGNHVHVAHTSNKKLQRLRKKAWGMNAGPVHEFQPAKDHLDCVHTTYSWHYRSPDDPYDLKTCAQWYAHTDGDRKRHNCAMDVQGPNRLAFLAWVRRDAARANKVRKLVPGVKQAEVRTLPYEPTSHDPRSRC